MAISSTMEEKKKKIIISVPFKYLDLLWILAAKEKKTVNQYIVDSAIQRVIDAQAKNTNK